MSDLFVNNGHFGVALEAALAGYVGDGPALKDDFTRSGLHIVGVVDADPTSPYLRNTL